MLEYIKSLTEKYDMDVEEMETLSNLVKEKNDVEIDSSLQEENEMLKEEVKKLKADFRSKFFEVSLKDETEEKTEEKTEEIKTEDVINERV